MDSLEYNSVFLQYNGMVSKGEIVFDDLQVVALKKLLKYDKRPTRCWKFWRESKKKVGVYLYGEVGRGKSLLTNLFYNCCSIEKKKRLHFNSFSKSILDLLHKTRCSGSQNDDQISIVVSDILGDVELLYLDEIQVRDICEAVILRRIFASLFARNLVVLMTSNYSPGELYSGGLQRELFLPAIDMIEKRMEVISLQGEYDYRVTRAGGSCKYYTGEGADQRLHERFLTFVGNGKIGDVLFTVSGRHVRKGKSYGKIAWFSFDDLCGDANPLWTADYQEIARRFPTIFIAGIPIFDFYSQNEMQRFIVLVDELYESGNNIFCSLAASPEVLYSGVPAVDFRRAVSRLIEMGSESWQT